MLVGIAVLLSRPCAAQENYEIQVYGSETVAPKTSMIELHSNFIIMGTQQGEEGVLPTNHVLHETVEVTQGITPWFETGFYVFTTVQNGHWDWVGDHIRPRVRAPEQWHWPVGVSLSAEVGYQRRQYATDTWSLELRPIVDHQKGRLYWSVNPVLDKGYTGLPSDLKWQFSPDAKISWDFTKQVAFGLEYYGSFGPVTGVFPFHEQSQQFVPAFDLDVSPRWEINFGVGVGATAGADHMLVKTIIGRRFDWGHSGKSTGKYYKVR